MVAVRLRAHDSKHARMLAAVRRSWDRIDFRAGVPRGAMVVPEAHYLDAPELGLSWHQRVELNRLMTCFTCELFVHFEGYVIQYLERSGDRIPEVPRAVLDRFVAEERVHVEAFRRLLHTLRPDLYPDGLAGPDSALRFLRWGAGDELAVRCAPVGTFFLLAWLFEEITLCMPRILAAHPGESAALVVEVMALHAEEEAPHVAIDEQVLARMRAAPAWAAHAQAALALPLLAYVDAVVRRAWRRVIELAAHELALTRAQRARLRDRGPSQSDRLGTASFCDKLSRADVAGTSLLRWALRRELDRAGP
jgi:hypothetical protein